MYLNNSTNLWTVCHSDTNPKWKTKWIHWWQRQTAAPPAAALSAPQLLSAQSWLLLVSCVERVCWRLKDKRSFGFFGGKVRSLNPSIAGWADSWKGLCEPLSTTSLALRDKKNDRVKYHYAAKSRRQSQLGVSWGTTLCGRTTVSWKMTNLVMSF